MSPARLQVNIILILLKLVDVICSVQIGSFKNIYHNIGGEAYALDAQNILIKDFTYDGEGPDAFFLAGTSGRPSRLDGDVVLPFPYEGEHFSYSDRNIPLLLRPFDGSEDVVLTLPPGYSVTDLKYEHNHITVTKSTKFR